MVHTTHECTSSGFLKCKPLISKGTEGAVGLAQWFEKMESVFHISKCTVECQVKFATCTLLGSALTWWNSHVRTVGTDASYTLPCTNVESYTQRIQEFILLCSRMVLDESDNVEKYTSGLLNSIQESVMASKLKMFQETIELTRSLMDQKLLTCAARHAKIKRKMDNNSKNNHPQQPPYKRQNVASAYAAGPSDKREYARTLPLCNNCKFHHNGSCATKTIQKTGTCFKCGRQGHFKRDCPKLKNQNCGNAVGNGKACGRAYALRGGEPNPNSNVVMGTFLLNNHYTSILFDTGVDTFSSLIDVTLSILDNCYDVKLADRRITGVNTIIRGYTLNLLNHPFNIDLIPIELGSFDAIIDMDWLLKYHVVIVCDGKIVWMPYGDEVLIVQGDKSDGRNES
nr:hypothetical protein [Tanacetum cinerariifolium]